MDFLTRKLTKCCFHRAAQPPQSFHVHSAAHATNAGIFDTPTAQAVAFGKSLNDSTKICSLSPFNTYYIVQVRAGKTVVFLPPDLISLRLSRARLVLS